MNRAATVAALCISAFGLSGCETTKPITMSVVVPAETDLSNVRRVAVMPFTGRGAAEVRSAIETALLGAQVNGVPYFQIVSRDQLDRIIQEQNLGGSRRFDDRYAPSIGRLLGADALVYGQVSEFEATDQHYTEDWIQYSYVNGKKTSSPVVARCVARNARVAVTAKFVKVATGEIIASKPLASDDTERRCAATNSQIAVADKDVMLMKVAQDVAAQLRNRVTPHRALRVVKLRSGDDGDGSAKAGIERGIQYATNGRWDLAIAEWETAAKANPSSAAAFYNLGAGYEAQGWLNEARVAYEKAVRLEPDPQYIRASAEIESRIQQADEVQQQTRDRR